MAHFACLDELQTWLDSYLNFEKTPQKDVFWLDTMAFLCGIFGNPQDAAPALHVAGSKGKGSVSAMTAAILAEAGLRTGLYTSPHITDFSERIGGARGPFAEPVYKNAARTMMRTVDALRRDTLPGGRGITWFELVTLFAFLCFREAKTDCNVLEVGLGGRLDATNVVMPDLCCITPIEREHTAFLGDTVAEIAAEKGGIIKPGVPVVVARQQPEAEAVLAQIAAERNARMYRFDDIIQELSCAYETEHEADSNNCIKNNTLSDCTGNDKARIVMRMTVRSSLFARPLTARLRLLGDVQAQNAALAAAAVKLARPDIAERTIERGLERATLPGRFEILPPGGEIRSPVVLDGAHTVGSVSGTLRTFRAVFGAQDAHLLFACAADKDMADIAPLFARGFTRVTLTRPGHAKQGDLAALCRAFTAAGIPYASAEDFYAAIGSALHAAEKSGVPLLVTGSFYLLAEVKKIIDTGAARAG